MTEQHHGCSKTLHPPSNTTQEEMNNQMVPIATGVILVSLHPQRHIDHNPIFFRLWLRSDVFSTYLFKIRDYGFKSEKERIVISTRDRGR